MGLTKTNESTNQRAIGCSRALSQWAHPRDRVLECRRFLGSRHVVSAQLEREFILDVLQRSRHLRGYGSTESPYLTTLPRGVLGSNNTRETIQKESKFQANSKRETSQASWGTFDRLVQTIYDFFLRIKFVSFEATTKTFLSRNRCPLEKDTALCTLTVKCGPASRGPACAPLNAALSTHKFLCDLR